MNKDVTKADIVKALLPVVKLTHAGKDITDLELTMDGEYVFIHFENGYKRKVDVACDSGISLIRDICAEVR